MSKQLSTYRQNQKRLLDDASTGTQRPPRVSIGNNQFTLIDPSGENIPVPFAPDGPVLDVVVVDRNEKTSKLFWGVGKTYNPNELAPPVCFSDNGVAPSNMAQEAQSPTCQECPHNVIGSAISQVSGARIKACGDLKKFAVVVVNFPGVYLLEIKPGSFKAWNNYTNFLRMQKLEDGGRPDLSDVVTRIRFVGQGVLSFEAVELVTDGSAIAKQVIDIWDRNQLNDLTGMMIGRFDQPMQGALPAPREEAAAPVKSLFQPPPQQSAPVAPGPAPQTEKPKSRGRSQKEEKVPPVMPAAPQAQHGMQQPQVAQPPANISARLDALFKLPAAK